VKYVSGTGNFQAEQTANQMYTTLISTDDLSAHLDDAWTIIDCRFDLQHDDWGRDQYLRSHIPGAVYAHLSDDMSAPKTGANGRHPWPSTPAMSATFSRLGVANRMQAVVYDQDVGMYASRLWWMLRYMGHDLVAVLDGGWAKWIREGRPTRSGHETRAATHFEGHPRPELIVDVDHVASAVSDPETLLVDARAPERFEGRSESLDRVAGHIPGAINRFFKQNVATGGTLLAPDQLRTSLSQTLGAHAPDRSIMYCGSGVTACHNLLALEHAGLPGAKLYPGSWSEWCADPKRPVATGK
jgi:thiosulfate/3-mercaptopyruvate sulfurtransferase